MIGLASGALVSVLGVAGVLAAPPEAQVRASVERVLDTSYQRELPGYQKSQTPAARDTTPPAGSRRTQGRALPRRQHQQQEMRQPRTFGSVAQLLVWVLVAVGAAVIVLWLVQAVIEYEPRARDGDGAADDDDPERAARLRAVSVPLGDAEALAAHRRFGQAIHTLLLQTLVELTRTLPAGIPRSLTSREILARVAMPAEARAALSRLVSAAELCHFGGAQPGEADYRVCRDHFAAFARIYAGARAPAGSARSGDSAPAVPQGAG